MKREISQIDFVKTVASGNDFVIIQNRLVFTKHRLQDLARKVCNRKFGIGADGLLVLEKSKIADFKMRIFNPDGSEAEMCGNGLRCATLWVNRKDRQEKVRKYAKENFKVETKAGILESNVNRDRVRIKMTEPKDLKTDIHLKIGREKYIVHYINTGVPHTILLVNDLEKIDVKRVGGIIRSHPQFLPQGTNVDFVKVKDRKNIFLRTYERGVEDETLACGTGAVASAIISIAKLLNCQIAKRWSINVHSRGGEILKVCFEKEGEKFKNVWLEGSAEIVYEGVYYYG